MKKILFLTDSYYSYPTANGICVEEIADELVNNGYEVHVLCYKHEKNEKDNKINGIFIHKINMDIVNTLRYKYEKFPNSKYNILLKKLMIVINRIQAMLFIHWFPMRNPVFCIRYLKKVIKLYKNFKFDLIIASYCPFEAAYSILKIKKYANVKTGVYCLDSFTNLKKRFFMSAEFQDKRAWKWEKNIYEKSDFIINLNCHKKYYEKERYTKFKNKMYFADIPHIIKRNGKNCTNNLKKDNRIRILYAGALRDELIKPLLEYLNIFLCEGKIYLDIYGRSTGELFYKYCDEKAKDNINLKGFIQHNDILEEEKNSDILLSMGNSDTDFIPSKIFEYISLGKKILHIYSYDKDSALPYYEKYPNCCCVNIRNDSQENIKLISDFIEKPLVDLTFEDIEKIYIQNTPIFTVNIINKMIKNKGEKNE